MIPTVLFALLTSVGLASPPECPTDSDRAELTTFADELRAAPSPEVARDRALRKVKLSRQAIDRAASMVPGDEELVAHQAELADFEQDVRSARSQGEVADRVDALASANAASAGCGYSTGEVIAVVLGFVLGVIPGIILLILLC